MHDVIISGAGPVGLLLACELALAQCSVLILEKNESPHSPLKRLPFGIRGLSAPSIDALYRRGLLNGLEIHKRIKSPHAGNGKPGPAQAGHFAGITIYEENIDTSRWTLRLPGPAGTHLLSEMEELETILARRAASLGVEIRRGLAITGLEQSRDSVTVHSDGQSFACRWLVGCDGARSVVRKAGGFEFEGTEPTFTGYSTRIEVADPEKLRPGRNITPAGMYLQSQPGYIIMQDFDNGAFHHSKAPVTAAHIQEVLRRISGTDVTVTALHLAVTWTDRARQATTYRNGRVLLAGDAAHIHSPLGGQGLNLGLGDAMNLGWKLAATIRGKAPAGLLDSYTIERHPVGAQVLDWSRAQVAIMTPDPHARALRTVVSDLLDTTDGATYVAGRLWGISNRYELGGSHPLTGRSVPDFEFQDGKRIGEFMHDGRAILLDFDGNTSLRTLADEYDGQIGYISANAKDRPATDALLIRPDGIIAWAAGDDAGRDDIEKAADRWFVRSLPARKVAGGRFP
ncbi:FAD-dependent monooxygenase [Dyadobacter sp. 676]|uniref:FAD-dependent monooxygenase n=1 Tax=Dyadobacter sp. 676 TaxID=3088362 RepID=A0AAU8FKU4_9BACT